MSCPEFKKFGFLFLSGELLREEEKHFTKHCQRCPECSEALKEAKTAWGLLEKLALEQPGPEVRKLILKQARKAIPVTSKSHRIKDWFEQWAPNRGISWGLSVAAVAVIFLLVVVRPFQKMQINGFDESVILAWEDPLMAEMEWLDNEIDRVQSGNLLTGLTAEFEAQSTDLEDDWISPMSDDIDWIRSKVDNLVKTVYGI